MPFLCDFVFQSMMFCLTQTIFVCFIFPWFTVPLVALLGVFLGLDMLINNGVREIKKVENQAKSPVLHHLTSAMAGVSIIRGFRMQGEFQGRFREDLHNHLSARAMFSFSSIWYMLRMDIIASVAIFVTAMFSVGSRGAVSPAAAGVALSNIFLTGSFIPFVMRLKAEFQARFNSIERITEYAELPSEAPAEIEDTRPPAEWPQRGRVTYDKVSFRYRPGLPLVLRDIDLEIEPEEKVGIVGRTGAGKTSLISTLMRLAELESGKIRIDDVDTAKLGLATLRGAVAVIPQDPVLFQGTIRYNLDPFDKHDDAAIWMALEKSHLKPKVTSLSMVVDSEGDNFSVGEKQLICLARALLRYAFRL